MRLNKMLVAKQDLTNKDIANIKKLHKKKNKLFTMVKYWMKKNDVSKIVQSGLTIRKIEFEMQSAWHFDKNPKMHSHWIFNPACSCPKMDNLDDIGLFSHLIRSCIVHNKDVIGIINNLNKEDAN